MRLGVAIEESWAFFNEVFEELAAHHETHLFQPRQSRSPLFQQRLNRALWRRDLQSFLRHSDVAFFEWSSRILAEATRLPKTCALVTRLHRYELYQWAARVNWGAVDRIILVSEAKRREFLARFPETAERIVVIPEAISVGKFPYAPKEYQGRLGTLCHLSPRKRVYELILAFSEIARRRPDCSLHIGGGAHPRFPDYEQALHSLVERLGLQERVTFYGPVENAADWYKRIDVFISNSYSEGLQVSPMEAIAAGCDCLSHAWDGAEELLPREHLFHTDAQLTEMVLALSALSPEERRTRQLALRERITSRFDVETTKSRVLEVVESARADRLSPN